MDVKQKGWIMLCMFWNSLMTKTSWDTTIYFFFGDFLERRHYVYWRQYTYSRHIFSFLLFFLFYLSCSRNDNAFTAKYNLSALQRAQHHSSTYTWKVIKIGFFFVSDTWRLYINNTLMPPHAFKLHYWRHFQSWPIPMVLKL